MSKDIRTIADLTPDAKNANRGTERGVGMLERSLRSYGAGRSILADRNGVVLAGNKTLEQAAALGLDVLTVRTQGDKLVVVVRDDLDLATDAAAKELAVADSRTSEIGLDWDPAILSDLAGEVDLSGLFFDDELATLLVDATGPVGGLTNPDDVPAAPDEPTTKPGDLWVLGRHRLLCGDATAAGDVERLMAGERATVMMTDPPYGVDYSAIVDSRANQKQGGWRDIASDLTDDDLGSLLFNAFSLARTALAPDAAWFCWHPAGANSQVFRDALEAVGIHVHKQIVWVKPHFVFGRWEYHWQHEPCFYGWLQGNHPPFYGDRSESTVWAVDHDGGIKTRNGPAMALLGLGEHPTQKPTELWARAIRNHTAVGGGVYDPFAGSGPAVIAAEQTGRRTFVLDIDPAYCDVIVRRWEQFTGQIAALERRDAEAAD